MIMAVSEDEKRLIHRSENSPYIRESGNPEEAVSSGKVSKQWPKEARESKNVDKPSPVYEVDFTTSTTKNGNRALRQRRASTHLLNLQPCGGMNCCRLGNSRELHRGPSFVPAPLPDNDAFKALQLPLFALSKNVTLTSTSDLPEKNVTFHQPSCAADYKKTSQDLPPKYITPHPPYEVFNAKIQNARCLTKANAEKRTYHFDLDVTDYPEEIEGVDFRVGGAIGVCAPNDSSLVNAIFDRLGVDEMERDALLEMHTGKTRWPTVWGEEKERKLMITRREILTWTVDIQSYPPTKPLLRLLAEYATDENEKHVLLFLCSAEGQESFCDLRTKSHVTLLQLLSAFPSSRPPLDHLFSHLQGQPLMARFYSLSADPHLQDGDRRLIEIAVTVHELADWTGSKRTGIGSGYMERMAKRFIEAPTKENIDVRIPMFRGLMANPMAKEFRSDGPMLLIGAGVGVAPFRGFVQRRLKSANCVNKVWVLQGIRDSLLDELYSGEWGTNEKDIKTVVESRASTKRYVQEEVIAQADLVWDIINSVDGRIFVCGSTKGMGEGVEASLVEVAQLKGSLDKQDAIKFWEKKKEDQQFIMETW